MKRAIPVGDLFVLCQNEPAVRFLFAPIFSGEIIITDRDKIDGFAHRVSDSLSDERWCAIVSIIRDVKKIPKHQFRMLENKGKGWRVV